MVYMEDSNCLFLALQNVKLTVKPASIEISAQSVEMGFTYTLESALETALTGWKPTTTLWSATILVSKLPVPKSCTQYIISICGI